MVRLYTPVTGGIIEVVEQKVASYLGRGFRLVDEPKQEKPKKQSKKKG